MCVCVYWSTPRQSVNGSDCLKVFAFLALKAEKYMRGLPELCIQSARFNSTQAGGALKWPLVPPTPLTEKVPVLSCIEVSSFIVFAYVSDTGGGGIDASP